MIQFLKKKSYKRKLIAQLEQKAYSKGVEACYQESILRDLLKLVEHETKRAEEKNTELKKLAFSHTREDREKIKILGKEHTDIIEHIKQYNQNVALMREHIATEQSQAAQSRDKAKFIKENL
ncbi:MAG: hypothetical protein KJI72_00150 [Patescibacteria group bacterium]|nr:hypothetical protein [Patescibacteria group bacterium]